MVIYHATVQHMNLLWKEVNSSKSAHLPERSVGKNSMQLLVEKNPISIRSYT